MQKKISIKNKITFSTIGIVLFLGIVAVIAVFLVSKQNFTAIKKDDIAAEVIGQTNEIAQVFANPRLLIEAGARDDMVSSYLAMAPRAQDPQILAMLRHFDIGGVFASLYVLDKQGTIVVSTDADLVGTNHAAYDYVKRALRGETFIEAGLDATDGSSVYYFSHPIIGADGSVSGVLVGKVPGHAIDTVLQNGILAKNGRIMFIDTDGIVFYSNAPGRLHKSIGFLSAEKKGEIVDTKRFGTVPIVALQYDQIIDAIRAYSGPVTLDFYDATDKENEIASIARIPDSPFFLVVEQDSDVLVAPALVISGILAVTTLLAAFFAAILVYFLTGRFLRPLGSLRDMTGKIKSGDYAYRLAFTRGDEFGDVADAFNEMADQLQLSYGELEQLVAKKTVALSDQLQEVEKKNVALQDTQRAVLNVLEDARTLELELQEERDRLNGILSSMGEGLFVVNKDLRIILVNPMAGRILGIPADQLKGVFLPDVIGFYRGKELISEKERPLYRAIDERVTLTAGVKDNVYWDVKGGRRFPLGFVAAPVTVGGFIGGVVIFRDITREKNLDDARTSFISITSHQLRTPLTSLKWFLEMLMDGSYAQPLTAEQKNFADLAYQAADRMMGIINLLLQIARVESGRVKVVPVATDLRQFAQNVVTSFGNTFNLKKQTVEIVAIPDPFPSVLVDNDILGQVLQNILSNANRYALENTTITIAFKVDGDKVVVSVTDKGIGITKADTTRIFEKFYRAENALRMVPEGSGLGLSLVKSLIEGWGGTIWFESEEWKGTTFFFTLPLAGMSVREGEVGIRVL